MRWAAKAKFSLLLFLALLSGCKVGPKHTIPRMAIPEEWTSKDLSPKETRFNEEEPLSFWSDPFKDPLLQCYIHEIVVKNDDIRIACANAVQAFYSRQIAAGDFYPQIDAQVDFKHIVPGFAFGFSGAGTGGGTATPAEVTNPFDIEQKQFLAGFDAFWELDLFGRTRSEVEAACATYRSELEARNIVLLSVVSEFVRTYLEVRRSQELCRLTKEQIETLEERSHLLKERALKGLDNQIEYKSKEAELKQLQATLPKLQADMYAGIYRLSFLLGHAPNALLEQMTAPAFVPTVADTFSIGVPSEVLRRRPDIRQAERNLAKATADVGVAVADLFPKLTLSAAVGYERLQFEQLKWDGESWSYNPNLLTPIFHGKKLRARVKMQNAARRAAWISYEKAVRGALEETESDLVRLAMAKASEGRQKEALDDVRDAFERRKNLFEKGLSDKITYLDARLELFNKEKNLVNQIVDTDIQLVALIKALGGCF